MRLPCYACLKRSRKRIASLPKLRHLRDLLHRSFGEFRGKDLGGDSRYLHTRFPSFVARRRAHEYVRGRQ